MQLLIDKLHKSYGSTVVLDTVDVELDAGQIACLLGPSGCGKTTLLRCVAGFVDIDQGQIVLNDTVVSSAKKTVPPQHRAVGMVFQDHALFPHLSVAQNAGFALHAWSSAQRDTRVGEVLDLVGLREYEHRYPHQLSGGQQQRAALARALANRPKLLLLDEPFSGLDQDLRTKMARDVSDILRASGATALWVTHDQTEAMQVADMMGVMDRGEVLQWASPAEIYHRPADRVTAQFLGETSFVSGVMTSDHVVQTALGQISLHESSVFSDGSKVDVLVRPDLVVESEKGVSANISNVRFEGASALYDLVLSSGETIQMRLPAKRPLSSDSSICVQWNGSLAMAFAKNST